jgi:hypothetical protein
MARRAAGCRPPERRSCAGLSCDGLIQAAVVDSRLRLLS